MPILTPRASAAFSWSGKFVNRLRFLRGPGEGYSDGESTAS